MRGARPGLVAMLPLLTACSDLSQVGRAPEFSAFEGGYEHHALYSTPMPQIADPSGPGAASSLWTGNAESLLGDRRAALRGDILTVVIRIDDSAQISNTTGRSRSNGQTMAVPQLFGLPQRANAAMPEGASLDTAVDISSASTFSGKGNVSRSEKLTLRIAATVVERLGNGVLRIAGEQEVRVNNELRILTVSGYVRPSDISRRNEIDYDKIAGARISYGGQGQLTDVQQPRYGQQIADILLPF